MSTISDTDEDRWVRLAGLLSAAMAASMLLLFVVGSIGIFLIKDLHLSRSALGGLVSISFGTAALLSIYSGKVVDLIGGRIALASLFAVVAVDFVLISLATTYGWLLVAFALGGVGQSLANPATNKLVTQFVSLKRRGVVVGIKQAGVQMGALVAGLVLPSLAAAFGWRTAARAVTVVPLLGFFLVLIVVPSHRAPVGQRRLVRLAVPEVPVRWLMGYSLFMGAGAAGMNSYLALYAHQAVGLTADEAGFVLAALAAAGACSRVFWSGMGERIGSPSAALVIVSAVAVVSALLVCLASSVGAVLLWVGAVGLGGSAVAAFAISMVVLLTESQIRKAGHDSAMVSLGIFVGFVIGALAFGAIVDFTGGYTAAWLVVAAEFAVAGGLAVVWRRSGSEGRSSTVVAYGEGKLCRTIRG